MMGSLDRDAVGIVGLGRIGGAVARHILASGRRVIGWARRPEALAGFVAQGGIAVPSLADLGEASIVITAVFDDAAAREIAFGPAGLVAAMPAGAVHVAMETISPALSRALHDAHAERGRSYLAAPVFGRPDAAARGELAIMCSGAREAYDAARPVLATAGATRWVGPEPEQAMLVKLAGNHMILTMGQMLSETLALLRAGGVDGGEARAALLDSLMPRIFAGYVERLAEQPDGPRPADSAIGRKDNGLVLDAARALGIDLPLARSLRETMPHRPPRPARPSG